MGRLLIVAVALAFLQTTSSAQAPARPLATDGVARLLVDLESAVASGDITHFDALSSAALPSDNRDAFARSIAGGAPSAATLRERGRSRDGDVARVLAEVFVSRGRTGRLATWQIAMRPKSGASDQYEIASLTETTAIGGLLNLSLDATRQFAVRNLTFRAPDLTLRMAAGSAFVAQADAGTTILVLRGSGDVSFAPPDAAEQGQLKIFDGHPVLETKIDTAFVRVNPAELASRLSDHSLLESPLDKAELVRAQKIFDDLSPRSFNLDLGDLSSGRWSLEPPAGSVAVDFKTARYGWLTYTRSPGEMEDIALFDRAHSRHLSLYASAEHLAAGGRFFAEDTDIPYEADAYDLRVSFDPARTWLDGRASVHVKIRQDHVSSLTFRLARSLTVSSVSSPGLGRLLALRVVGQSGLVVSLPQPVNRGTELVIDLAYAGRLPPQGFDREALTLDDLAGVQDPPRQLQDDAAVVPEPRFMYSSRVFWYPRAPVTDYATATMRLTVPSEYQVVGTGAVTATSVAPIDDAPARSDPRYARTVEFRADRPVPYLACVISRFGPVGNLRVDVPNLAPSALPDLPAAHAPSKAAVNIDVVATPRQISRDRLLPARVADMFRVYTGILGEAPYPNFTLAAADDNLPGGHSPAYFAMWQQPMASTPYSWQNDPVAFDSYAPFFLAHEVAHQWWGQAIEWKNYHEQWLSEGLAQYFAVMYAGADRGPEMMRSLLCQMRQSAAALSPQGPIYLGYRLGHIQGDSRVFRGLVYNKSAVVLHMLRRLIGDEAFLTGLQRFYHDWRFRPAGTDDLRAAFEAGTSIPLRRFFDRWILGSTLPRVRVTSRIDPSGHAAVVRIEQIGETFDLPLSVSIQYADGRSEDVTIAVTDAVVETRLPLTGPVRRIVARDDLTLVTIVS